jgi:quercetin dioxygenase-like cupin family protein
MPTAMPPGYGVIAGRPIVQSVSLGFGPTTIMEATMRLNPCIATLALVLALGVAAAWTAPVGAHQGSPATGCVDGVTVTRLGYGLPSAADGQQLTLLRVTFDPGGSIGAHVHPGALTLSIESGALVYAVIEGEAELQRPAVDGTPVPAEPLTAGQEMTLNPGDWVFEEGIIHSARNDGADPAVVLIAGLMRDGEPFTQCDDAHATSAA